MGIISWKTYKLTQFMGNGFRGEFLEQHSIPLFLFSSSQRLLRLQSNVVYAYKTLYSCCLFVNNCSNEYTMIISNHLCSMTYQSIDKSIQIRKATSKMDFSRSHFLVLPLTLAISKF